MRRAWRALEPVAKATGRAIAAAWRWLEIDARTVQFYGGLALIGFTAGWRLTAVGALLVAHAVIVPLIITRRGST